jgi:hypothetical protein
MALSQQGELGLGWNRTVGKGIYSAGISQCKSTLREATPMSTLLLIVLVLALLGALPSWPYSRGWGYGPSGIVGAVLVLLLIVVLLDRAPV